MGRIGDVLTTSMTRVWLANASGSWRRLPRPLDEPYAHAPGDDPDRVLVVGNGISVGYGVLSHQIGFGGHLARQLAERTQRGSEVQLLVAPELDVRASAVALVDVRPTRFDAIVLTLGGAEAMRLVRPAVWRDGLDRLLDGLLLHAPGAEIFVVGVAPLGSVVRLPSFARARIVHRGEALATHARQASEIREGVTFIPFEPRGTDLVRNRDRHTYEEWASIVASGMAERLSANADRERAIDTVDEQQRLYAVESLGVLDTPDARFAQITETARSLFGVASASLNFVDRRTAARPRLLRRAEGGRRAQRRVLRRDRESARRLRRQRCPRTPEIQ